MLHSEYHNHNPKIKQTRQFFPSPEQFDFWGYVFVTYHPRHKGPRFFITQSKELGPICLHRAGQKVTSLAVVGQYQPSIANTEGYNFLGRLCMLTGDV